MMEMPEQKVPAIYPQMLQMFPNIPQDVIWQYVQQYSSDIEKCAQMLNLQNTKYTETPLTALENQKNLNECIGIPPLILIPRTVGDNNNGVDLNGECDEQTEQTSYDSHSSYSTSFTSNILEKNDSLIDFSNYPHAAVNFDEPLILDIVPDDEGISHSWRPSNSDDMLCPNIFVPSPATKNFQPPRSELSNSNSQQKHLEFHLNPRTVDIESGKYSMTAQMLYNYPLPDWGDSSKDIASYLHYQKSQMNTVRYEVIKAKIELSDVKERIENLEKELKEKMQSKSVQDIIDLNKEIEQLRLDCQSFCSEIDKIGDSTDDLILLGDVDERIDVKNVSPVRNTETHDVAAAHSADSNETDNTDIQDESNKWHCPDCTFANHPAISVCEMCQLPNSVTHRSSFMSTSHPRENTLPIQS